MIKPVSSNNNAGLNTSGTHSISNFLSCLSLSIINDKLKMTSANTSTQSAVTTVLVFGDATDSWVDGLDQLYKQAGSTPWLKSFLDKLTDVVNAEAKASMMDRTLQNSLRRLSRLEELGEI